MRNKRFVKAFYYDSLYNNLVFERWGIQYRGRTAYILWNLGRKDEARQLFNEQIEDYIERIEEHKWWAEQGWVYYELAGIYSFLGEKEKAYQFLNESEKKGPEGLRFLEIQLDPLFESLWQDEDFKQFIRQQEKKFAEIIAEIDRMEEEGI